MLRETIDVVLERSERNVAELLARPFADRPPDVGLLERAERQTVAALTDIEAELAIEILRDGEIRHREMEMIDRMNTEFAWAAARRDVTVDRCHGAHSRFFALADSVRRRLILPSCTDSIQRKIFLSIKNNFSPFAARAPELRVAAICR